MPVHLQFGKEDQLGALIGRLFRPSIDAFQNLIDLPQRTVNTDGGNADRLHVWKAPRTCERELAIPKGYQIQVERALLRAK